MEFYFLVNKRNMLMCMCKMFHLARFGVLRLA